MRNQCFLLRHLCPSRAYLCSSVFICVHLCSVTPVEHSAAADHAHDLEPVAVTDECGGVLVLAQHQAVVSDGDARVGDLELTDDLRQRRLVSEFSFPPVDRHPDHTREPVAASAASTAARSLRAA